MTSRQRDSTQWRDLPPELVAAIMNRTNTKTRIRARAVSKALHQVVPRETRPTANFALDPRFGLTESDPYYNALRAVHPSTSRDNYRARVAADDRIRRLAESGAKIGTGVIAMYQNVAYLTLPADRYKTTLRILQKAAGKQLRSALLFHARNANNVRLIASTGANVARPYSLGTARNMHIVRHAMNVDKKTYEQASPSYLQTITARMSNASRRPGMESELHRKTLMRLLDKAGPRGYAKMLAMTDKPNDNALVRKLKLELELHRNGRAAATAELPHAVTARAVGHLLDAGADPWRNVNGKPAITYVMSKPGMNAHVRRV